MLVRLSLLIVAATAWADQTQPDPDTLTRERMVVMARQLGVTCTHCHDPSNFKSAQLTTYKVAQEHIRITNLLNSKEGFNGKPTVDCYTCHRGEAQPAYREPVHGPKSGHPSHLPSKPHTTDLRKSESQH